MSREEADSEVTVLRAARQRPAVLKLQLAKLKSNLADYPVLAFEGDDDKLIYNQWIARIQPTLTYLSFPCGGKGPLLTLRSLLLADQTGLRDAVYFFIDRDFDELREAVAGADIFMTERYSVENYLVDEDVVRNLLEMEFHCHADPKLSCEILDLFNRSYTEFLEVTREANERLYVARKLSIDVKALPTKVGKLASIGIDSATRGSVAPDDVVCYLPPVPAGSHDDLKKQFLELAPPHRYRGKFALLFFQRWLDVLAKQNTLADRGVFKSLASKASFRVRELTVSRFASRSPMPEGLTEFVMAIPLGQPA